MVVRRIRLGVLVLLGVFLAGVVGVQRSGSAVALKGSFGGVVYVSPSGVPSGAGYGCLNARYSSINAAVAAAPVGGTVVVCPGTYHEDVLVNKALELRAAWRDDRRHRSGERDSGGRLERRG